MELGAILGLSAIPVLFILVLVFGGPRHSSTTEHREAQDARSQGWR